MALALNSNADVVVMTVGISAGEEAMYVRKPFKTVNWNCMIGDSVLILYQLSSSHVCLCTRNKPAAYAVILQQHIVVLLRTGHARTACSLLALSSTLSLKRCKISVSRTTNAAPSELLVCKHRS
jgi:hypothetical protein